MCIDIAVTLRDDYGITDLQDFTDLYAYHSEEYNWESEFAQYWFTDVMGEHQSLMIVLVLSSIGKLLGIVTCVTISPLLNTLTVLLFFTTTDDYFL